MAIATLRIAAANYMTDSFLASYAGRASADAILALVVTGAGVVVVAGGVVGAMLVDTAAASGVTIAIFFTLVGSDAAFRGGYALAVLTLTYIGT